MKKIMKRLAMVGGGVAASAGNALAQTTSWTPSFTVDTAPVFTVAGIIVTAIGGIWAVKKVIKLANRS